MYHFGNKQFYEESSLVEERGVGDTIANAAKFVAQKGLSAVGKAWEQTGGKWTSAITQFRKALQRGLTPDHELVTTINRYINREGLSPVMLKLGKKYGINGDELTEIFVRALFDPSLDALWVKAVSKLLKQEKGSGINDVTFTMSGVTDIKKNLQTGSTTAGKIERPDWLLELSNISQKIGLNLVRIYDELLINKTGKTAENFVDRFFNVEVYDNKNFNENLFYGLVGAYRIAAKNDEVDEFIAFLRKLLAIRYKDKTQIDGLIKNLIALIKKGELPAAG